MIDFDKLKHLYQIGRDLTIADVQVILKSSKRQSFEPGEFLIVEGQKRREIFFIRKGIVRAFKVTEKGEEITTMLRWEHQVVASPRLILFNQPSVQYFEAIEAIDVYRFNYDTTQKIIDGNPKFEKMRKQILQKTLKDTLDRIDSFVLQSPEERYLSFIKNKPAIADRVPNKYIAHVLGITPVSLSRIRKRIKFEK